MAFSTALKLVTASLSVAGFAALQDPSFNYQFAVPTEPQVALASTSELGQKAQKSQLVSMVFRNAKADEVLAQLEKLGINFVVNDADLQGRTLTLNLIDVTEAQAMQAIATALGGRWEVQGNIRVFAKGLPRFGALWTDGEARITSPFASGVTEMLPPGQLEVSPKIAYVDSLFGPMGAIDKIMESFRKSFDAEKFTKDFDAEKFAKEFEKNFDAEKFAKEFEKSFDAEKFAKELSKLMSQKGMLEKLRGQRAEFVQPGTATAPSDLAKRWLESDVSWQKIAKANADAAKGMADSRASAARAGAVQLEVQSRLLESKAKREAGKRDAAAAQSNAVRAMTEIRMDAVRAGVAKGSTFKMINLEAFLKSLTKAQRELHKKQGFLKLSDLSTAQRDMLGQRDSKINVTFQFRTNGEKITIKGK